MNAVDRTTWFEDAACRNWSSRVFFWDSGSRVEDTLKRNRAKGICFSCPVRRECLTSALHSERADSLSVEGAVEFLQEDWINLLTVDCGEKPWGHQCEMGRFGPHRCERTCRKHWYKRSRAVATLVKPFTISMTPPYGVLGGFTAEERHRPRVKHLVVDGTRCVLPMCRGCRPTEEWVEMLLKEDAA